MPHHRRTWMQACAGAMAGLSVAPWFAPWARTLASQTGRRRQGILLWMPGGPSQMDTFDLKPQHENGGEFAEIATSTPGLRWSEHLPKLAEQSHRIAVIRSLSTREGDHERATYLARTGYIKNPALAYPTLGSAWSKQLRSELGPLPPFVSIGFDRTISRESLHPAYIGPRYGPLLVNQATPLSGSATSPTTADAPSTTHSTTFADLQIDAIRPPSDIPAEQQERRLDLWRIIQKDFVRTHAQPAVVAHQAVYERSLEFMESRAAEAFDLSQEPRELREAYGTGTFGQGCLLARRLIEFGVPFVEVALTRSAGESLTWDTHANNFAAVKSLSAELDAAWSTLLQDLAQRGLLETTTLAWLGEFGRTPRINPQGGRDHFPRAWSAVLAGGGIAGGQAYGQTSPDGMEVIANQVSVQDVLATFTQAMGISPEVKLEDASGRPIALLEGTVVRELLS